MKSSRSFMNIMYRLSTLFVFSPFLNIPLKDLLIHHWLGPGRAPSVDFFRERNVTSLIFVNHPFDIIPSDCEFFQKTVGRLLKCSIANIRVYSVTAVKDVSLELSDPYLEGAPLGVFFWHLPYTLVLWFPSERLNIYATCISKALDFFHDSLHGVQ